MSIEKTTQESVSELRSKAEEKVATRDYKSSVQREIYTSRILHELEVHHVELEMQNEELSIAHRELARTEELYRSLFNQSAVGIAMVNVTNRKFIEINRKFSELLGYTPDEMKELDFLAITHEDDRQISQEKYALLKSGSIKEFSLDKRFIRRNGEILWLNVSVKPLNSSDTKQPINIVMAKDVTKSKEAEESLRKSEERYRTIFEQTLDAILYTSPDGTIITANPAACSMFGISEHELCAVGRSGIMNQNDPRLAPALELRKMTHKINTELTCIRSNGEIFPAEISSVITSADPPQSFVTIRDITMRKQAETEMRKLSRAIEQSPVSIVITDTQGIIEFVNPKFSEITGYSSGEAIGLNPRVLKSGNTPPETYKKLWSNITAGKTWEGEFINKHKNGNIFFEHATISPLRDDDGIITHYLAVKEDITEKKNLMEQLVHAQKIESVGQLAGGLAHDLNNILTVVNGYVALMQIQLEPDHGMSEYINEIAEASSRAASLTHSLLAYSRKQVMNQQNLNLNTLITTIGKFIARILHDNIELSLSLGDDSLVVNVDSVQIEQVLLNLATNARDAMPDGGRLSIDIAEKCVDEKFISLIGHGKVGRYAVITVSDTGFGMDNETISQAFNPFFTTKEIGRGTGLGLAMVFGIIKQHGGFIDLQSQPGCGSVFQLYLPLVDKEDAVSATGFKDILAEKGSGTILLAEDDDDTRNAMEELLTRAGYTVITAVDGQDAVGKFAIMKNDIDLVISDVVMPRKSGKAACDEIRRISDTVKFIFVSGHASNVIEREGEFEADTELLMKPILPFDLLRKIRTLLQ